MELLRASQPAARPPPLLAETNALPIDEEGGVIDRAEWDRSISARTGDGPALPENADAAAARQSRRAACRCLGGEDGGAVGFVIVVLGFMACRCEMEAEEE